MTTKLLTLADLEGYTETDIQKHWIRDYKAKADEVRELRPIIAYESVGDYGCDSNSFFLMEDIIGGRLFEVHGSHCSCYGFENQFMRDATTKEYLLSDKFSFSTGGYDNSGAYHIEKVKQFLKEYFK